MVGANAISPPSRHHRCQWLDRVTHGTDVVQSVKACSDWSPRDRTTKKRSC